VPPNLLRIVVISDLHLSPDRDAPSPAATRFVESLAAATPPLSRLIVLGDFFDLCRAEDETGSAGQRTERRLVRLDAILTRHAGLSAALAALVASGVELDVVAGNHDLALADPMVAAAVVARLGGADRVHFHDRSLWLSGVLYAEHGSQYHDINAVRGPAALDSRGRLRLPPAAYAEAVARIVRNPHRTGRAAALVRVVGAAAIETASRPLLRRRPKAAGDLESLARTPSLPMAARVARVALTRRSGGDGPAPPLERIDAALRANGAGVPLLVFAHTHVPGGGEMAEGGRWLNSGAWLAPLGSRYPFVEIDAGDATNSGEPRGRVRFWDDATATIEEAPSLQPSPTGP
jgi:hypothetical protein